MNASACPCRTPSPDGGSQRRAPAATATSASHFMVLSELEGAAWGWYGLFGVDFNRSVSQTTAGSSLGGRSAAGRGGADVAKAAATSTSAAADTEVRVPVSRVHSRCARIRF